MATTAASVYFLTCCRPIHNSFCFLVEKPKLIDFYNYPPEYFLKHPSPGCKFNHEYVFDHNLNNFNVCTDARAWSLDDRQKRRHFRDLICGRIPHCGPNESRRGEGDGQVVHGVEGSKEKRPIEVVIGDDQEAIGSCLSEDILLSGEVPSSRKISQENLPEEDLLHLLGEGPPVSLSPESSSEGILPSGVKSRDDVPPLKSKEPEKLGLAPSEIIGSSVKSKEPDKVKSEPSLKSKKTELSLKSKKTEPSLKSKKSEPSLKSKKSEKLDQEPKDVVGLTDELIEKLDRNLRNLESTFDKFVKKNRDFIQNLVECLDFEKQKQKALEDDYNKLKLENEDLKTQNDYLKMVNNKQLDLFKNELDKGINENKVIYKRKIHLMERQLQNDQNELQMYKQTEKKYMEVVEQDNEKIEKLNDKIEDLKNKEVRLVKNYLKLLKFLENVKNILSSADPKEIPQLRSLNTVTDSEGENEPDVKRVLRSALNNGISTLNVRDLSILHDAIEGLDNSLCHQEDKCTKSPTAGSSFPDFSTMIIHRDMITFSHDEFPKQSEVYDLSSDQSVDRIPTRQKPGDRHVKFP